LALLRLNAEKLRSRLAADAEGSTALSEILEEADHLRRITDALLFLATVEGGAFEATLSEVAADALVRDFSGDAAALGEDACVQFRVSQSDHAAVRCDPTLIRQLLLNVVTNAFRVSPPGGCVELESTLDKVLWRLAVSDDGPGLPPDRLEHAFERFVRFSTAAGQPDPETGHGLGLAICRSIATLHGGTIRAENRQGRSGLRVVVEIPQRR